MATPRASLAALRDRVSILCLEALVDLLYPGFWKARSADNRDTGAIVDD